MPAETAKDRFERNAKSELWILKQSMDFTAAFPKPGRPLDYSEISVRHLDELAKELNVQIPSGPKRLVAVYGAGAYFGEVVNRNLGGRWALHSHPGTPFFSKFEIEGGETIEPFKMSESEFNGEGEGFDAAYRRLKGIPTLSPAPMRAVIYWISVTDWGPKKDDIVNLMHGMFHLPAESKAQVADGSVLSKLNFPSRSHVEAFVERIEAMGAQAVIHPVREPAPKAKHPLSPGQPEKIAAEAIARHRKPNTPPNSRILLVVWNIVEKDGKFFIEEKDYGLHPELYFATRADAAEFLSDICLQMLKVPEA